MSGSSNLNGFRDRGQVAVQLVSCGVLLPGLVQDCTSSHMAAQKQDDQHERTFSSYVRIRDAVLKTYLGRWTIGWSGERGSGISELPARYDDDDEYYKSRAVGVTSEVGLTADRRPFRAISASLSASASQCNIMAEGSRIIYLAFGFS